MSLSQDCNKCESLCCRLDVILHNNDYKPIIDYLGISLTDFVSEYTYYTRYLKRKIIGERDYCVFVTSDFKCSIYEYRPKNCREFNCSDVNFNFHEIATMTYQERKRINRC